MRILVLNPHMSADYSGPTVFMNRLFGEIALIDSFQVTALGPELPSRWSEEIEYITLKVPDLRNMIGQITWFVKSFTWLLKNKRTYDAVHFHGVYAFNLLSAFAVLIVRKPFAVLPLGAGGDLSATAKTNRIPFLARAKRIILKNVRRAYALSESNAMEMSFWGVPETQITRLNNPASLEFFTTAPHSSRNGPHDILFVGKVGAGKNPNLVVEALSLLMKAGWHDASLTFVGPFEDSQYEKQMRKLVADLGCSDRVSFLGYVPDFGQVVTDLVNAVFVLPSSQEGLPGALTEAMAMGIPAVVTDVGSMGEVVQRSKCGYVVKTSPSDISGAIHELWVDHGNWLRHAKAARSYAQAHFSTESVAKKYIAGFKQGDICE